MIYIYTLIVIMCRVIYAHAYMKHVVSSYIQAYILNIHIAHAHEGCALGATGLEQSLTAPLASTSVP